MTTYIPVASSEVTPGVPVNPVRFNGDGGVRREWWWKAGPVDSCCCCCSLRAGVGLLAATDFLQGIWIVFLMKSFTKAVLDMAMEAVQEQYDNECTGAAAGLHDRAADCADLKDAIENAQHTQDMIGHEPTAVTILGVLCILAGVVGLWAVFCKSAGAAKLYLWSWPVKFILSVVVRMMQYRLMQKYDVDGSPFSAWSWIFDIFFFLYFLKVSWSYRVVLKQRNRAAASNEAHANAQLNPSSNVV